MRKLYIFNANSLLYICESIREYMKKADAYLDHRYTYDSANDKWYFVIQKEPNDSTVISIGTMDLPREIKAIALIEGIPIN